MKMGLSAVKKQHCSKWTIPTMTALNIEKKDRPWEYISMF